jgi:hypothetical protein
MGRSIHTVLYVVVMMVVIFGVDFLFLRNRFGPRLLVNIGLVLAFGAVYLIFLRR